MKHYKVVLEMEVDADNPLEAAQEMDWMITSVPANSFIYVVQDDETGKIHTVDLGEPEDEAVLPDDDHQPLIS